MSTARRRSTAFVGPALTSSDTSREPEQLLDNVRSLLAEAQALSSRLAALNEIAVAMQTSVDSHAMLLAMARQARWVLDFQQCVVVTRQRNTYRLNVVFGIPMSETSPIDTLTERAISNGHALLTGEMSAEDGGPPNMQSALILPLRSANEIIGTLNFYTREPHRYTQNDLRIASALALQVAAILHNQWLLNAVQRSHDELHTILESIGDGVLVLDLSGRILLLNGALQRLLGISDTTCIGARGLVLLRCSHAQRPPLLERSAVRELWQTVQQAAWPLAQDAPPAQMLALSDGSYVELASVPLLVDCIPMGYVLTVRDVSARMELERMREDLTQMLVHDLRSPLTSVLMGLDMLEHDPGDSDRALHSSTFGHIRTAAGRLLEQINTLLDVSKLEAHRLELDQALCNVPILAEIVIAPLLPLARTSAKTISIVADDNLPSFVCDVRLIQRALQNLVDNALKFTPDGGTIVVEARIVDTMIEVMVRDSGPGVPRDERNHIFEKYGQARHTGHWRGTGLGLTFCKLVVEAHSGQIGVRDAPNGGSEFWFTLPFYASA